MMRLAELDIGKFKHPTSDPRMAVCLSVRNDAADEASVRLQVYKEYGTSEAAFGRAEVMDMERLRSLRCA